MQISKTFFSITFLLTGLLSKELWAVSCKEQWKQDSQINNYHYVKPEKEIFQNNSNLSYQEYYQTLQRTKCQKDWTILIYMQADNDLTAYAFWDLYEMESSFKKRLNASTLKTDVIVQLDTQRSNQIRRIHMFQSQTTYDRNLRYEDFTEKNEENIFSPTISLIDEVSEDKRPQKEDFKNFLDWAIEHYPSQNYLVIIWGHGQGWSFDSAVQFGGVAFDDTQKSKLSIPDISEAIKNKGINIISADACLMQTVEVATELSESTRYIIGSTQVQNYMGLPYRRIFYEINSERFLGLKKQFPNTDEDYIVAKLIPTLFKQSFHPQFGLQGRIDPDAIESITMSSINAAELKNILIPELKNLGQSLLAYSQEDPFRANFLKLKIEKMPKFLGGSRDLGTFLGHLKEFLFDQKNLSKRVLDLGLQIDRTMDALNLTLVHYTFGTNYQGFYDLEDYFVSFFKAFGIWLPNSKENYAKYHFQFENSHLYKYYLNDTWGKWLESMYQKPASLPFPFSYTEN